MNEKTNEMITKNVKTKVLPHTNVQVVVQRLPQCLLAGLSCHCTILAPDRIPFKWDTNNKCTTSNNKNINKNTYK